jgi:hypothetical protein
VSRIPADKTLVATDKSYNFVEILYQIVDFFKMKRSHIPAIASSLFKIIDTYLYSEFFMTPQNIYIICFVNIVVCDCPEHFCYIKDVNFLICWKACPLWFIPFVL